MLASTRVVAPHSQIRHTRYRYRHHYTKYKYMLASTLVAVSNGAASMLLRARRA